MKRVTALLAGLAAAVAAQAAEVEIKVTPVAGSVHMLQGQGGNIAVSSGVDGTFMIDDQFAPLTESILEAVKGIGGTLPRLVVNTHWHGDHTGGNENLGKAGSVILAHENVRVRMSTDQFSEHFGRTFPASPRRALPVVTFTQSVTIHLNDDEIDILHMPKAHTDGDSIVHFKKANVIHMGDIFFNGMYPFIDIGSGGSVEGVVTATEHALKRADEGTKIIPGHGPLTDKAGLQAYRDMLLEISMRIATMKKAGLSLAEVKVQKPTADWDETWGGGFIPPAKLVEFVYESLK